MWSFQWQKQDKSLIYLTYRWTVALFFIISVAFSIVVNIKRGHFHVYFIYLTHLNLFATMLTMLLGALLAHQHFIKKAKNSMKMNGTLINAYWLLHNQSVVLSCIVSIFYWGLIHKGEPIDLNNVLIHITNSAVLLIDLLIVRHPANYKNFVFMLIVEMAYMLFTAVFQFCGGLNKWANILSNFLLDFT